MGLVRHRAKDHQETDASQAPGDQDRVAQNNARPHRENRCLGETDAERASELLRCLEPPPEPVVVLQQGEAALARIDQAAPPNGAPQLGEVHPVRRPLLSANQNDTPAPVSPLRRQNPREEPGALAAHAGICTGGGWQRPSLSIAPGFPKEGSSEWQAPDKFSQPSFRTYVDVAARLHLAEIDHLSAMMAPSAQLFGNLPVYDSVG